MTAKKKSQKIVVGCKVLRPGHLSLLDKVDRPRDGAPVKYLAKREGFQRIRGRGAFVAVSSGLFAAGGHSAVLEYFECRAGSESLGWHPEGVTCFREVRRLAKPVPERIRPRLAALILNGYTGKLSADHRAALEKRAKRGGYGPRPSVFGTVKVWRRK